MFEIGWETVDITPDRPAYLAGQLHTRLSTHVQALLTATVLAMESGDAQAIIISCDLLFIPGELQTRLSRRLGEEIPDFDSGKLILCATHTHCAPFLSYDHVNGFLMGAVDFVYDSVDAIDPGEYFTQVLDSLATAARKAWTSKKAGRVSSEFGYAVVGHNRRMVYKDGSARLYGYTRDPGFDRIEGPADHGVELLYIWDAAGELTGVVANVACPAQMMENHCFITSDYWSEVRTQLNLKFGKDLFLLPLLGAAGDISPHGDLIRHGGNEPDMGSVEGMEEIGRRVVALIWERYQAAKEKNFEADVFMHLSGNIQVAKKEVELSDISQVNSDYLPLRLDENFIKKVMVKEIERKEDAIMNPFLSVKVHVLRIGDIAITANPFEMYTDYGFRIKAGSGAKQTFIIQMACGLEGYLPTRAAVRGRGYSALLLDGMAGPEGGDVLVDKTVEMINGLW